MSPLDAFAARIKALPGPRVLVAVTGAPGAGKSTLAEALAARLDRAEVIGMDGFHYDDAILGPRGLLPRKGAPESFDIAGFHALLTRLRANAEPKIAIPVFDRAQELSRNAARLIAQDTRILIVEGNYLMLTRPGWSALRPLFDLTASLIADEPTLRARLTARWQSRPAAEIHRRVEQNDLPNGRIVHSESAPSDLSLHIRELPRL